jgi:hypothetical protein
VAVPPVFSCSLSDDSAYIRSFVHRIDRPVMLVGHSYGGAVITVAGVADNLRRPRYLVGSALEQNVQNGGKRGLCVVSAQGLPCAAAGVRLP